MADNVATEMPEPTEDFLRYLERQDTPISETVESWSLWPEAPYIEIFLEAGKLPPEDWSIYKGSTAWEECLAAWLIENPEELEKPELGNAYRFLVLGLMQSMKKAVAYRRDLSLVEEAIEELE